MNHFQLVKSKLGALQRRLGLVFTAWGFAIWLVALVSLLLLAYGLDTFLHLPLALRAIFDGAALVVLVVVALRFLVYPLTRKPGYEELAMMVETEFPVLNDRLITSLQMAEERNRYSEYASRELIDASIEDGLEVAARLNFLEAIRTMPVVKVTGLALLLIGLFGTIVFAAPETAETWRNRMLLSDDQYPARFAVGLSVPAPEARRVFVRGRVGEVEYQVNYEAQQGVDLAVGIGSPLIIHANVHESGSFAAGDVEDLPVPTIYMVNGTSGIVDEAEMMSIYDETNSPVFGRYYFVIKSVPSGLDRIYIEAGDGTSQDLAIRAEAEPIAEMIAAEVSLPSYIPRNNEIYDNSQLGYGFKATADSTVRITTNVEEEMAEGYPKVYFRTSTMDPKNFDDEMRGLFSLVPKDDRFGGVFDIQSDYTGYELIFKTKEGVVNTTRTTHRIQIIKDLRASSNLHYFGPGLRSLFEVPVVYYAKVPLVYSTFDNIEIDRRELGFIQPPKDESDKDRSRIPLTSFAESYATRRKALDTILAFSQRGPTSLNIPEWQSIHDSMATIRTINEDVIEPVKWLEGPNDYVGGAQLTAWQEMDAAYVRLKPASLPRFMRATERYATESTRRATDRYVLKISDLLDGGHFSTADKVNGRYVDKGDQPLRVPVRIAAFDKAPTHEKTFDNADEITFMVGPRRYVSNEIANRISNQFFRTLSALRRAQERLLEVTQGVLDNHPSPSDLSEEEIEAILQAREEESFLRRDLSKLEEHARLVGQTYFINELSLMHRRDGVTLIDANVQGQELNIVRVRLMLALLSADPTQTSAMKTTRAGFDRLTDENREKEAPVLMAELAETFGFARDGFTLGNQIQAGSVKVFFDEQIDTDPATFERINEAYAKFGDGKSGDLTSRFNTLKEIRDCQEEMVNALTGIDSLLKKWQSFDRIRVRLELIAQELDVLVEDIYEFAQSGGSD